MANISISTWAHLASCSLAANANGTHTLMNNLDSSSTGYDSFISSFVPIGYTDGVEFTGTFDGNGFTISDLIISTASANFGLFYIIGVAGTVKDLGLLDVNVTGVNNVGALAGRNNGTITNCYSTGAITGNGSGVGGLIGYNRFGGGAGGDISECYSTCSVSNGDDGYTGGFIGYNKGTVYNCFSTGSVNNSTHTYIGGFVGINETATGIIHDCFSSGAVTGGAGVGGFVSDNYASITNCYASGLITYTGSKGGFCCGGDNAQPAYVDSNNYWNTTTVGYGLSYMGFGLTDANAKKQSSYSSWDFGTVWSIVENTSMPQLQWFIGGSSSGSVGFSGLLNSKLIGGGLLK